MEAVEVTNELKAIGKDALNKVIDQVLPKALELAAAKIPGQIDDVLLAALKPVLVAEAKKLVEKI